MIYLKYGVYSGTSINWSASESFRELEYSKIPSWDRIIGKSLRQASFAHKLSAKNIYQIRISADELQQVAKLNFIEAFFSADEWKLSENNWTTEFDIVPMKDGKMPIQFIEGIKALPEIEMIFIDRNPA